MRKTVTRFLTGLFIGLLALAVPFSHAIAQNETAIQDAQTFLKQNAVGFNEKFDENSLDKTIPCGTRRCNTTTHDCLVQEDKTVGDWAKDIFNYLVTTNTYGLGGDITSSTHYKYVCVLKEKAGDYRTQGWKDIELDENNKHKNLASKSSKVFGGAGSEKENEQCYDAKSAKGEVKRYCFSVIDNQVEVHSATTNSQICEVVPVKWYNNRKCRFCSLLGVVYAASETVTKTAFTTFAHSFAIIIVLGMAIWLAFKTLTFISSLTKQDAAKYITEIIRQSYKFMIAYFALVYYPDIFEFIIRPLLSAGLTFSESFVSVQDVFSRFEVSDINQLIAKSDLPSDYARNLDNFFYSFPVYIKLENFAYNVNLNFTMMQTIGQILRCLGGNYIMLFLGDANFGLGFACIIYGIILSALGWLLSLAFIFYIFDAVVQLGLVGGLLPFLVASWPFKITSKYTSTGFKMFLNSIFNFMMMGVVVKITMELIDKGIALNTESANGEKIAGGFVPLADAIDRLDTEALSAMVNVLSVGFLVFMFACVMGFLLLGRVSELTDRFASGGMKAVAPSIATMGASMVKGAATKLAAPTVDAVSKSVSDGVSRKIRSLGAGKVKETSSKDKDDNKKEKEPISVGDGTPSPTPDTPKEEPTHVGDEGSGGRKDDTSELK